MLDKQESAQAWRAAPPRALVNAVFQLSLDFGAEFGFRFASIKSAHNLYFVAGFDLSPQMLDAEAVRNRDDRATNVIFVFETAAAESGHDGPNGAFTVVPGIGYRFSFGRVFQLGGRLDFSYAEENCSSGLGWLTATGFGSGGGPQRQHARNVSPVLRRARETWIMGSGDSNFALPSPLCRLSSCHTPIRNLRSYLRRSRRFGPHVGRQAPRVSACFRSCGRCAITAWRTSGLISSRD